MSFTGGLWWDLNEVGCFGWGIDGWGRSQLDGGDGLRRGSEGARRWEASTIISRSVCSAGFLYWWAHRCKFGNLRYGGRRLGLDGETSGLGFAGVEDVGFGFAFAGEVELDLIEGGGV